MKLTAIIPTWRRTEMLRCMLQQLRACRPGPDEIIVHVDAGDEETEPMLASEFQEVRVLKSTQTAGPGGGRNKLVQAARTRWIASFDDDSWPSEIDFFEKASQIIEHADGQMIACNILEAGDSAKTITTGDDLIPVASFAGCGCVFNRNAFLETGGYVPLRYAYGMEESDVAIKLLDHQFRILFASALKVHHACDRDVHHADPHINAAQISNTILLAFLRYPIRYWPLAWLQFANRILFSVRSGRWRGILKGISGVPFVCWRNRTYRKPVSVAAFNTFRRLRDGRVA